MDARIRLIQAVVKSASEKAATRLLKNLDKVAKCWEGYERVPGTKPMTPGSCRPVGEKKEKETKKKEK